MPNEIKKETPATPTTVEVNEPVKAVVPQKPTVKDVTEKGWEAGEIEAAKKAGLIVEDAPPKTEEKKEEGKKPETPEATKTEEKKPEDKPAEQKPPNGSLPDFTMTPEQEEVFLKTFGQGTAPRAMYFRMKNERRQRQAAEQKAHAETAALKAELDAIKASLKQVPQETDEDGNPIDPEDKPLTMKALRQLQEQEMTRLQTQQQEQFAQANRVTGAQQEQEEFVRSNTPDFDTTVTLAKEVMQNIDSLLPAKWQQDKAVKMIQELQVAAASADKIGLEDYNAAWIAYEIGKLHPKYGASTNGEQPSDGKPKDPKASGGYTPEQMERMKKNTERRGSSASLPGGGGRRTISVEDVDLPTFNRMSYKERIAFRDKHPEKYARLARG